MHPAILTENSLTVIFKDGPQIIHKSSDEDKKWEKCLKLFAEKDWKQLKDEMNTEASINRYLDKTGQEEIVISGGQLSYNGAPVDNYVVKKIIEFKEENLDIEPLVNFLHRLMKNPSKHCIDKLYRFLEQGNMPVDNEGFFYAYKAVTCDFKDKHTRTIYNRVGDVVTMPRRDVDDHSEVGCSQGLHAGSIQYVSSFGGHGDKIVIVKIDPADVVTVPDEDVRKLRCCRYEVVQEYEGLMRDTTFHEPKTYAQEFWGDDDEEDGEECTSCGQSPEFCDCEFCEDCGVVIEDCKCSWCDWCGELLSKCTCERCEKCKEVVQECCCQEEDEEYEECQCDLCKTFRHAVRCGYCGRFKAAGVECPCQIGEY